MTQRSTGHTPGLLFMGMRSAIQLASYCTNQNLVDILGETSDIPGMEKYKNPLLLRNWGLHGMSGEKIQTLRPIIRQTGYSLHAQILQQLRETLESGYWQPNEKLPTEQELQKFFGVSRSTIRQALIDLTNQGYIYRRAGKGTFVSPAKIEDRSLGRGGYIQERYGNRSESVILEIKKMDFKDLEENIQLDQKPDTCIVTFKRLLIEDNVPFGISTVYSVLKKDAQLTKKQIEQFSISNILFTYGAVTVAQIERSLEAVLATEVEGKLLKVAPGSPLLLSKSVRYAPNGDRVAVTKALYRGDKFKYKFSFKMTNE